ncbi:MAG TPA: ABC transporter substrate-binding protein [Negativicutes bacterium]|nr:ABC transporter substrate-binding protein [Negativicutes bacterium]
MKKVNATKKITLLIGAVLMLAFAAGCAGTDKKAEAPKPEAAKIVKVRYSSFGGLNGLVAKFGKEKGFFNEDGLDVEFVEIDNPIAGLTSGDVDIADTATTNAIIGAGRGAPIKIVASMFRTKGPFYLIAQPDIKSVEDLKGKKIGVSTFGNGMDVYTRIILKKHGLDPNKDVTLIANGSYQKALASLETKQVDATIIHEPFVSFGEASGKAKLLVRGWDYLPNFHTGVLTASDKIIKEQPEAVAKVLKAYFKSQEYAKSHLDEYLDYAAKKTNLDKEVLKKAFAREIVLWENNPNVDIATLNDTQQIQLELGFQDKIYDVGKMVDLRFIPKK